MPDHWGLVGNSEVAPPPPARQKAGVISPVWRILLAVIMAVAALVVAGCTPSETTESAPDFTIVLYQGEAETGASELVVSDLQGTPLVLNFWAGLCPPCRAEMPEFQEFHDEFEGRARLVGVDMGQFLNLGSKDDARKLLTELGVTYAAGYTDDSQVVQDYRVLGLPTTVFINADGELHKKWDGVLNLDKLTEITEEILQ